MNIERIIEESLQEQRRGLLELPEEVGGAIRVVMSDIEEGIADGKASPNIADGFDGFGGFVNVIPSKKKSACSSILITFCYKKDNLNLRIKESLDHATLHCPDICRQIFLLTTQWDSKAIDQYKGYIKSVRQGGVEISFIHITPKGIVLMPV